MSQQSTLLPAIHGGADFERRATVRYQCSCEASCSSLAPFERLHGKVRDVSTQGIGLVLRDSIREGTQLVIDLKTRNPGIYLTLLARVVHTREEGEGAWTIGCEFITVPTEEQLQALQ